MNPYYQGDLPDVSTLPGFQDQNGNPIDPTTINLRVGRRGVTAQINVTGIGAVIIRDSVGVFHANLDTTLWVPDAWWYRWTGTGAAQATNEGTFLLLPVDV